MYRDPHSSVMGGCPDVGLTEKGAAFCGRVSTDTQKETLMRGFHFVTGWVAIGTSLSACTDETRLTDEERATFAAYQLPSTPPPNASNQFADDARAAVLGKQFFFDTRFSGALNAPNDGVTNGSLGAVGESGRVACVSCHDPALGGSDHRSRPQATSFGASYVGRNAPSVINAAYSDVAEGGW